MRKFILAATAFAALGLGGLADEPKKPASGAQQQKVETPKDPVCGMEVDAAKAEKLTHEGKTYYFCSKTCKAKFEKNPAQYTKAQPKKS